MFEEFKVYLSTPLFSKPEASKELYVWRWLPYPSDLCWFGRRTRHKKLAYYISRVFFLECWNPILLPWEVNLRSHSLHQETPAFQAHIVVILIDQLRRAALNKLDTTGYDQMGFRTYVVWSRISTLTFYQGSSLSKSYNRAIPCKEPIGAEVDTPVNEHLENQWVLHVDSFSNASGLGAGLILTSPEGDIFQYALRFGFSSTNNDTKYEALIAGWVYLRSYAFSTWSPAATLNSLSAMYMMNTKLGSKTWKKYLVKVKDLTRAFQSFDI